MYFVYLLSFKSLYFIGLKKTSVQLSRNLEQYCRKPLNNSKLYKAVWDFNLNTPQFPLCDGEFGCYFPMVSDTDSFHAKCREAQAAEDARIEDEWQADKADMTIYYTALDDQQHLDELMAGFCTYRNPETSIEDCFEEGDHYTGRCSKHDTYCHHCDNDPCACVQIEAELDAAYYDGQDNPDDECQGGCGETERNCVCAELASLRRYNATPLEERCGPWTA